MSLEKTIVVIGDMRIKDAIQKVFEDQGYQVKTHIDRSTYVHELADSHVSMVCVDADIEDWQYWVTAPKINPATRRIPIIMIVDETATVAPYLTTGADDYVRRSELSSQLSDLFLMYGRVMSPDMQEQLACECQESLPDLARQGIEKFNAGEYYRQHDLFEELWVATVGPVRDLYRAILQVGVAYFQVERGNRRGALKMLLRSIQWLNVLPDQCQGVDVAQLREDSLRVRAELESIADDEIDAFDRRLLKPVKWHKHD